jgi:hypothetical protein
MIGIGSAPQTFSVLKHFGWRIIFHFRNYFKPKIFCRFYFLKKYSLDNFVSEKSLEPLEELITGQHFPSKIASPRNLEQYKWRISNPNFDYQIVSYRNNNICKGFIIYYVQNNKILLFDFVFTGAISRNALLWYLSRIVTKNKYKGIVSFCQENGFQSRLLKKSLFVSNPFRRGPLSGKFPFLIYADEATMEKYSDPDKWIITGYDHDAL